MKKKFVLASLLALTLSSCNWFTPKVTPSSLSLENIVSTYYVGDTFIAPDVYVIYSDNSRSGNVKNDTTFTGFSSETSGSKTVTASYIGLSTSFTVTVNEITITSVTLTNVTSEYVLGDEFIAPTVTAHYNNGSSRDISDEVTFTGYDMDRVGDYEVDIKLGEETLDSFDISVSAHVVDKELVSISLVEAKTEYYAGDDFEIPVIRATYDDESVYDVSKSCEYSGYNMYIVDEYEVVVTFETKSISYNITVSKRPPVYEKVVVNIDLVNHFGNKDLAGVTSVCEEISFQFSKNGGSNSPKSDKSNGGAIYLYQNNMMKISGKKFNKVEFTYTQSKIGPLSCDTGSITNSSTGATWTGEGSSVIFTADAQARFRNLTITYLKDTTPDPVIEGISTVKEVKQIAESIKNDPEKYVPNDQGWYLSNTEVKMKVEAIDAIDSAATSEGYDGNARGKVLVVDETGYIMCSSSTSTNEPISFYQRVKDYIKKGTTQYEVSGHIAFLNGVPEVKVDTYEYNSSIVIDKKYEEYVEETFTSSDEFVSDTVDNALPNAKGYGVNHIVKMTGLTYFNKYNSAGSYLFLDQDGKIVPVYSLLDKDRTMLVEGQVYDIIGLESVYKYRPSFRILKVSKSSLDPVTFDFENDAVEVTNLSSFYSIGEGTSEAYVNSELTIYKADVYVSSYGEDKYTINTSYHVNPNGGYTTGYSEVDAANHDSLGIFNEELDYKQVLLDYLIDGYSSEEDIQDLKVTLYFTLAYLNTVNKKNMWRVNIFEDVVYGLDYYHSEIAEMTFDTSKSHCDREDGVYQQWSNDYNSLVVRNESTEYATIQRNVDYLRVVDSTSLKITFDHDIVAFTFYTGTYSGVAGLGSFTNVKAYVKRSTYITVVLKEKTKTIDIDELYVSGSANYLKVTSMSVNYI